MVPQVHPVKPLRAAPTWFDDAALVRSLPAPMRAYAAYSRAALLPKRRKVLGGSFLLRMYRRLTPLLHLPREARVVVGGRVVHLDLTDARFPWVLDEVRGLGHEYRVMQLLLKPGDTFLDVGANHGSFAILASHLLGPRGRVIAVEPQAHLARLTARSLEEAPSPFEVHCVALGDRDGEGRLYVPREGSGMASIAAIPTRGAPTVRVPVRRADDLFSWRRWPGALMLKLDIEGGEYHFLRGATEMLRERRPVVLFELSAVQAHAAGYTPGDLITEFRALGYDHFSEVDRYPEHIARSVRDLERQRNLIALP